MFSPSTQCCRWSARTQEKHYPGYLNQTSASTGDVLQKHQSWDLWTLWGPFIWLEYRALVWKWIFSHISSPFNGSSSICVSGSYTLKKLPPGTKLLPHDISGGSKYADTHHYPPFPPLCFVDQGKTIMNNTCKFLFETESCKPMESKSLKRLPSTLGFLLLWGDIVTRVTHIKENI